MKTLGRMGFCALPSTFDSSSVVVVSGENFDRDISATRNAPKAILRASHNIELQDFDESFMTAGGTPYGVIDENLDNDLKRCGRLQQIGVATLDSEGCDLNEFGHCPDGSTLGESRDKWMEGLVKNLVTRGKIPIVLGGDQNVTVPTFKGLKQVFSNLVILHFDACLDMREAVDRATGYNPGYNHRAVMRYLLPETERIISVGSRNFFKEEMKFARQNRHKIDMVRMRDQLRPLWHLNTAVNRIISCIGGYKVYVSFDVSFLDPSTIGASAKIPEPGGITYDEVLDMWSRILQKINVVGADFVGFCPTRRSVSFMKPEEFDLRYEEEMFPSSYAMAKLIARFISRLNI